MDKINGIWITWESQRRNYGISSSLGFPLFEIKVKGTRLFRYLISIIKTTFIIFKTKPNIIVAQNPSLVLAIMVIVLRYLFLYKVVIDAHNGGLFPCEGKSSTLLAAARWVQKKSDLTIVTNSEMVEVVELNGGTAFILPDKIPVISNFKKTVLSKRKSVAFICTYSDDEPYLSVIDAARLIDSSVSINITGKYGGKVDLTNLPENINLLGYIPESNYWLLLQEADIVMDLTLRQGCLVCGAYEALAVKKILILSNTDANKNYFSKGCVYVDSDPESIANGINYAIDNAPQLHKGIIELKISLECDWNERLLYLKSHLNTLVA